MADVALARREARRKRILENSQNRLKLISNVTNDEFCRESPVKSVQTSIPEPNNEIPATTFEATPISDIINNGVISNEPESYELLYDDLEDIFGEQEISNDSAAFVCPKSEPSETSLFEKLTTYKYDLVLLSMLIQLLHSFSVMPLDNTYFFLPLILYTITKIFFFKKQETSKYANILLLLSGLNSQTSQHTLKLMSILHGLSIIGQDACIYIFTTICIQSLFIMMNNFIS